MNRLEEIQAAIKEFDEDMSEALNTLGEVLKNDAMVQNIEVTKSTWCSGFPEVPDKIKYVGIKAIVKLL